MLTEPVTSMDRERQAGPISRVVGLYQTFLRRSLEHFFPDAVLDIESDRSFINWDGSPREEHFTISNDPDGVGLRIDWFRTRYVFQHASPTDADSVVTPSWYADNMSHLELGADCVAGYIDAEAVEIVSHGAVFLARGRLEDTYLRLVAEIYALCDPRPHDPWPNHRVSSGASLAVKLAAMKPSAACPTKLWAKTASSRRSSTKAASRCAMPSMSLC